MPRLASKKRASGSPPGPKDVVFGPHPKASPPLAARVRRSPDADELPVSSGPVRGAGGQLTRTICLCLLVIGASTAWWDTAEASAKGTIEAGLSLGYGWLDENNQLGDAWYDDNILASSLLIGLRGGYNITEQIGAELELRYLPTELRRQPNLGQRSSSAHALSGRLHGLWHLPLLEGKLRIFGLVGAGFDALLMGRDFRKVDPKDYTDRDADALLDVGIGAKYTLLPTLQLRADLRWLGTAGREPQGSLSHALEFQMGAAWVFGAAPDDPDGDGVTGSDDKCPNEAEDKDGFEDTDGCPDLDNDGDKIPDSKDKCPDEAENLNGLADTDGCPDKDTDGDSIPDDVDKCPKRKEDKDGFEDTDGCPEFDNDGDGIADNRDKCPNEAEDKDGFDDLDGCPDKDNDNDGVPDAQDRCRDEPETVNGFRDADGCPDVVPKPLLAAFGGPTKGVDFDPGQAHLGTAAYKALDERLKLLKEFTSVRIVVVGHVQSSGDLDIDKALSEERAKLVAAYFVNRGVAADRVTSRGLGSAEPLSTSKSKAARRKNERIEMHLVVK